MTKTVLQTKAREEKKLTIGEWFEVTPESVDISWFRVPKVDAREQWMCDYIYKELSKMRFSGRNLRPFEVFVPEIPGGKWSSTTPEQLKGLAISLGGDIGDEYQLAYLWAQMLKNGHEWNELLPESYIMVFLKEGKLQLNKKYPTFVGNIFWREYGAPFKGISHMDANLKLAVPFVVRYPKTAD